MLLLRRLLSGPIRRHIQNLIPTTTTSSPTFLVIPNPSRTPLPSALLSPRCLSTFGGGNGRDGDENDGSWKLTPDDDDIFGGDADVTATSAEPAAAFTPDDVAGPGSDTWSLNSAAQEGEEETKSDVFGDIFGADKKEEEEVFGGGGEEDEEKPWSFGGEKEGIGDVFGGDGDGGVIGFDGILGDGIEEKVEDEDDSVEEEQKKKEMVAREQELKAILKGPSRAFGDLVAASGITEDMIASLILLKDVRGVPGLPPLSVLEDRAIAKMHETSTRTEIEKKKQEEIAAARVSQIDSKGRAYGTGYRKCSSARVWIEPGEGKFIVNDKQFDAYFPSLDHRAELLRPFTVTKTLGLWDVKCTAQGGGISGQVGAIRLGISRALQNFEPGFRPFLKAAGYITRDSRIVERKKPGKAKARKSFQWVKR